MKTVQANYDFTEYILLILVQIVNKYKMLLKRFIE